MGNRQGMAGSWAAIRSVLPHSVAGLQTETPDNPDNVEWLTFHWNLAVGKDLAEISRVDGFSGHTLRVSVQGKEWMAPFKALRHKIIAEMKRQTGMSSFQRIVFKQETGTPPLGAKGPALAAPVRAAAMERKREPGRKDDVEGNLEMIKDQELKEILTRLSGKIAGVVLLLAASLFISNCSTIREGESSAPSTIDLSSSYAIRELRSPAVGDRSGARDPRSYYHYLIALKAERDYLFEEATDNYRQAVAYDPKAEGLREKLATHLLREGRIDELTTVCEKGLEFFPNNLTLNMTLADVLAARGEYVRAHRHYEKVTEIDPGGSRAFLLRGTLFVEQGEYQEARKMFEQVVLVEPSNPLGHHYMGREDLRIGYLEEAEREFRKSVSLKPNFVEGREHLAWVLEKLGKNDEAIKEYNLLLKLQPGNRRIREHLEKIRQWGFSKGSPEATNEGIPRDLLDHPNVHLEIASIYYEQAMYLKSLEEFRLLLVRKESQEPHVLMARIYEILGRLDKAIAEFETLRKMTPESIEIITYMARLYSLNDDTESAIPLIQEAISIEPGNDSLYHSLALAHMTLESYDSAIEAMRQAITLNANKDSYYFELGALLERAGEYDGAIENMQRTLELNPMHSNAHNFLGYMYAQEGRYLDKALDHLKKALAIQPRNGYFLDSLGWIYFKKGDSKKALSEIQKAMVYTPPDPVLYDHLGDILFSLENYSEASGAWRMSLSLTRVKKDDLDGEMPDPQTLQGKIDRVEKILQKGL